MGQAGCCLLFHSSSFANLHHAITYPSIRTANARHAGLKGLNHNAREPCVVLSTSVGNENDIGLVYSLLVVFAGQTFPNDLDPRMVMPFGRQGDFFPSGV